ncbi:hypothetical protein VTK56DRAFT_4183 [Thermocarpiscus australiensis]
MAVVCPTDNRPVKFRRCKKRTSIDTVECRAPKDLEKGVRCVTFADVSFRPGWQPEQIGQERHGWWARSQFPRRLKRLEAQPNSLQSSEPVHRTRCSQPPS